jgi:peroxiredoxin Q/BCP
MSLFRATFLVVLVLGCGLLAVAHVPAGDTEGKSVKQGEPVPAFEATDDQGQTWKSTDHVGKSVLVVYFYPADFTGGCTAQACGFRDDYQKLADKGVQVVGVSGDSAHSHALFKEKHKLPFTLLADEHGKLAKMFGVPTRPGGEFHTRIDGKDELIKRGVTEMRWTFVIGKDGKLAYKNEKVNAGKDSKAILEVVERLNQ